MKWLNTLGLQMILLFTLILFVNSSLQAQQLPGTVIGTVYDDSTKDPLISTAVYLSGTTIGAASNSEGNFTIRQVPPGIYELSVRYLGYEQQNLKFEIQSGETINFGDIFLRVEPLVLGDVIVEAKRDQEWLDNYSLFKRSFLGQSKNADLTEIMNPGILEFSVDRSTNELIATAPAEIHIVNQSLGYELFTEIDTFRFNTRDDVGYNFHRTRFVELETADPIQQDIWNRNRNTTYNGSFSHFLKSLVNGTAADVFNIANGEITHVNTRRAAVYGGTLRTEQLVFLVETKREIPLIVFYQNHLRSEIQFTFLNVLLVDNYGNLMNPDEIILHGDWALERMADMLPTDKLINSSDGNVGLTESN